jgi:hypothetical protein
VLFVGDEIRLFQPVLEELRRAAALANTRTHWPIRLTDEPVMRVRLLFGCRHLGFHCRPRRWFWFVETTINSSLRTFAKPLASPASALWPRSVASLT